MLRQSAATTSQKSSQLERDDRPHAVTEEDVWDSRQTRPVFELPTHRKLCVLGPNGELSLSAGRVGRGQAQPLERVAERLDQARKLPEGRLVEALRSPRILNGPKLDVRRQAFDPPGKQPRGAARVRETEDSRPRPEEPARHREKGVPLARSGQ